MNALQKKNILFSILFIAILTPVIFFVMGIPMILQMKGYDAALIGSFQLIGLPMVFKFIMSAPIDRYVFEKRHYKKWIFYSGIVYALLLVYISFLSLEDNISLIFVAIFITALISTFIDIPLNALAIKIFTEEERFNASTYKVAAYSIAAMLGSGVFLLFYNHLGWRSTFILMSVMLLVSLYILNFIEEPDEVIKEEKVSLKKIISFFKQKDISIWIFILGFYFAFISAIWVFMKPYLISKGVKADDIAIYVGIYGSLIGFLGALLISKFANNFSRKTLLLAFIVFNIISASILVYIEQAELTLFSLILSITFIALSISLSSAIIFTMIMDYARKETRAIDYSIQASFFSLTRIISAVIAGLIISTFNFQIMFIFETIGMIIVCIFIYKFYKSKKK
ncbi:MAG: MFS transporter [Campylobacteraceae bacterium]|nr:MFS transporter [Campylobacteraceae bacterium]